MRQRKFDNPLLTGPGEFKLSWHECKTVKNILFEADNLQEAMDRAMQTIKDNKLCGARLIRVDKETKQGVRGQGLEYIPSEDEDSFFRTANGTIKSPS